MSLTLIRFFNASRELQQKLFRKNTILKTYHPSMKSKHLPTNTTHLFKPPINLKSEVGFFKKLLFSPNHKV